MNAIQRILNRRDGITYVGGRIFRHRSRWDNFRYELYWAAYSMKYQPRHFRWILADFLCCAANRLRGHSAALIGYDIYGNEAAALESNIDMRLICSSRLVLEPEEVAELRDDVARLGKIARATWWHDPKRYDAETTTQK